MKLLKSKCDTCTYRYERRKCTYCMDHNLYEWKWLKTALVAAVLLVGLVSIYFTSDIAAGIIEMFK